MAMLGEKKRFWLPLVISGALSMLLMLVSVEVYAQSTTQKTYTVVARNVPLDQALQRVASATGVNLIYDTRLVEDQEIYCVERDSLPGELLRCVLAGTGLDFYQTSSGTYVLIKSVLEAPRFGRLAGAVVDEDSGEPLPYASVLLADAGVGTAANEAGLFSLSTLRPGPHQVVISYVGYDAMTDSVWIVPGSQTREKFELRSRSISAEPILVRGLQQRVPSRDLGQGELSDTEITAGLNSVGAVDVARSAGGVLGMALHEPSADLYLQGGAAGELQMHLDRIPVRSPVTVGQLLGSFSPLAIERMTVYKAGYGAAHGSHLSGNIEAHHAVNRAEHSYVTAQVDPLSVNGRAQAHWTTAGGVETSVMLAGRTSIWAAVQDPTLSTLLDDWHLIDPLLTQPQDGVRGPTETMTHRGDVSFSDVHASTRVRVSPLHTLHASLYRGHSEVESEAVTEMPDRTAPASDETLVTRDSYHWTTTGGQVQYEGLLGSHVLGSVGLYATSQSLGHGYRMGNAQQSRYDGTYFGREGPYDGNRIREMALTAGLDVNLMKKHHLTGAFTLSRISSRALINNDFFRMIDYSRAQWQLAGYVQNDISLGLQTQLELGTRLTYIPDRETVYAEPRVAFRYDGTSGVVGDYAFRLAGGVYRQFVNQFDLSSTGPTAILPFIRFWLPVDHSLAPPRSYHLAADALLNPKGPWKLNLEGYYKWQPHLLAIDYPALLDTAGEESVINHSTFISPSRGRAFGGDVRLQYSTPDLRSAVSYSFLSSRRQFPGRFDDELQPVPWEHPHRISTENDIALTSNLKGHINWQGVWGRSWGFRRAYYDYLVPLRRMYSISEDPNDPSRQTLPPLYQIDLGLSYKKGWDDVSLHLRAEILNALDRRNAFDITLRQVDDGFDQLARHLPGRRPVFSLRVSY